MSTITTINATDKPRLSREVINTNFANLNASKAEIADVVLLAGSYSNPSWITTLAWAKITGAPASYAPSAHTHPFDEITGTIANAQVPSAAVTQHQSALALAASQITSGALALARGGTGADLSASGGTGYVLKQTSAGAAVTVAALVAADIPSLDTAKITTGTFADARIAASNVTQHQAALTIAQSQVTNLTTDLATKVGGAPSLTTAGAVTFVLSPGVLTQDGTNLVWDNTNKRLGVGTASPTSPIHAVGRINTNSGYEVSGIGTLFWETTYTVLRGQTGYGIKLRVNSSTDPLTIASGGSVGIGPSNTAPTGTASILDRTAVTGATSVLIGTDGTNTSATATQVIVQAGAGQGSTDVLVTRDGAGSVNGFAVDSAGRPKLSISGVVRWMQGATTTSLNSASLITWASTVDAFSAVDIGLSRASAGVLEVNNGTAGTLRDLSVRNINAATLTNAGTLALSATGANVITLATNGSEAARISSGGNFLVGLNSGGGPKFEVRKSSTYNDWTSAGVLISNATTTGKVLAIGFDNAADVAYLQSIHPGNAYKPLALQADGGRVLVGTTTDDGSSKLQVAGIIAQTNNTGLIGKRTDSGNAYIGILNSSNQVAIGYNSDAVVLMAGTQQTLTLTSAGTLTHYNPTATTGVTSLVVRAGAGQGTTALQSWKNNSDTTVLSVDGVGQMRFTQANTSIEIVSTAAITSNAYNDGSWKYRASTGATYLGSNSDAWSFLTAPSGTAGNAITWATMFKINSTGIGFFGVTPVARQSATDLAGVIAALQLYGLLN